MVPSNDSFNSMRNQMELYIANMEVGRVINSSKGGADIQGAKFEELGNIIKNDLRDKVVSDNWLSSNRTNYNKIQLKNKLESMDRALEEALLSIREYNVMLNKIYNLVRNRNFKQLDNMYNRLDKSIIALESNPFFITFILQMNRVQHKLLADAVKISKLEKDIYKKHIDLLNSYRVFIEKCSMDIELLKPIYMEMNNEILSILGEDCI